MTVALRAHNIVWLVVLEHFFSISLIIPTDFHSIIFQRGRSTTNQQLLSQLSHCYPIIIHIKPYKSILKPYKTILKPSLSHRNVDRCSVIAQVLSCTNGVLSQSSESCAERACEQVRRAARDVMGCSWEKMS